MSSIEILDHRLDGHGVGLEQDEESQEVIYAGLESVSEVEDTREAHRSMNRDRA